MARDFRNLRAGSSLLAFLKTGMVLRLGAYDGAPQLRMSAIKRGVLVYETQQGYLRQEFPLTHAGIEKALSQWIEKNSGGVKS